MNDLKSIIKKDNIQLLIWDFDGVIFDLDWYYQTTPEELLEEIYQEINKIDSAIINDKEEFIARLFPYPDINEVGIKLGKDAQDKVKLIFQKKESAALDRAVPNQEVIDFIKQCNLLQSIWSNNLSSSIEYLLKKSGIEDKIKFIASLDKVILAKPDIEGFELIQNEYPQIDKKNILFIGDSLRSDKVAAENVGVKFFHYHKK